METIVRKEDVSGKIRVSSKRQITIPIRACKELDIGSEVEWELKNDTLVIRPADTEPSGEFDDLILADLIKEGYQGEELLEKFRDMRRRIRPAFLKMLEDCEKEARAIPLEELFGSEDDE